jgi:hypothetical protein
VFVALPRFRARAATILEHARANFDQLGRLNGKSVQLAINKGAAPAISPLPCADAAISGSYRFGKQFLARVIF